MSSVQRNIALEIGKPEALVPPLIDLDRPLDLQFIVETSYRRGCRFFRPLPRQELGKIHFDGLRGECQLRTSPIRPSALEIKVISPDSAPQALEIHSFGIEIELAGNILNRLLEQPQGKFDLREFNGTGKSSIATFTQRALITDSAADGSGIRRRPEGKEQEARRADAEIAELHRLLFVESNPIPVKWAVSQMGYGEINLRLPMTVLAQQYQQPLREALVATGAL